MANNKTTHHTKSDPNVSEPELLHVQDVKKDSPWRSILKTISWRIIATATTMFIAWVIIGDVESAMKIGGIEVFLKLIVYYLHERAWTNIRWGKNWAPNRIYRRARVGIYKYRKARRAV